MMDKDAQSVTQADIDAAKALLALWGGNDDDLRVMQEAFCRHRLASQPTSAEDAWRPIATAPKRGRLLLHVPHKLAPLAQTEFVGWWSEPDGRWLYYIETDGLIDTAIICLDPTHWMPLPAAPGTTSRPTPDTQTAAIGVEAMREDRYSDGYSAGLVDASSQQVWMQDKAWQDAVLMLVHYRTLAERTWLVGHEDAAAKLSEWWKRAAALAETKTANDIAALSQPVAAPQAETAGGALRELIDMLTPDGRQAESGAVVFDHTPEEIGLHVMENYQAIHAALSTPPQPEGGTVAEEYVEAEAQFLWDQGRSRIGLPPSRLPKSRKDYRAAAKAALQPEKTK